MALIGGQVRNADTHVALWAISVMQTGNLSTAVSTDGNGIWNAAWGFEGINVTFHNAGFYPFNTNFTSADWAWYPDYGSYGYWKVVELTPKPPEPSSCFTGDTQVLMADGTTRPISRVKVGEQVLSAAGVVNTVLEIERPILGGRKLFAFDEGIPFVTSEHPFADESGWRCIDPWALGAEGVTLEVDPLRVGDQLRRVVGVELAVGSGGHHVVPRTDLARLTAITEYTFDRDTVVYNLLLDGDHTYVANGYVVHNKPSTH